MPARLTVDPVAIRPADLTAAVAWLLSGGIVAYPTDTLYGLAADPRSETAVRALFDLKGRAADTPIPLLAASAEQVERAGITLDPVSAGLAARFWPGPLSLVLDAPPVVVPPVQAGTGSVAVRVPAHPLARALADAFGYPVTATSANRSGEPAVAAASELGAVGADWRVLVLDGGRAPGGAPSTIVDARQVPVRCVREGAVAWACVLESLHE